MKNTFIILIFVIINLQNSYAQKYEWKRTYEIKPYTNSFVGIDNFDSLNIMAVEEMSVFPPISFNRIVKSTDGGITWDTVYKDFISKDTFTQALSISYPTIDFCIIGTNKNYIIKTTDGGKNWTSKKIDIKYYAGLQEIFMYDDKHGVTYDHRNLVITHDGFESYKVVTPPMYGNYRHAVMLSPSEIYVVFLGYN